MKHRKADNKPDSNNKVVHVDHVGNLLNEPGSLLLNPFKKYIKCDKIGIN